MILKYATASNDHVVLLSLSTLMFSRLSCVTCIFRLME
jgi:hypothetical protein